MRRLYKTLLATTLALSMTASSPALAQSRPTRSPPAAQGVGKADSEVKAGKLKVEVRVVYATTDHSRVDARLGELTRYLSNLKYTGYELIETESAQLAVDGSTSFALAGGRKVKVSVLSKDERRSKLRVQILESKGGSKLLDTTLTINRNGTFIVAGPKYKHGILVLPLTITY